MGSSNFCVFEKFTCAYYSALKNCTRNHVVTYTNYGYFTAEGLIYFRYGKEKCREFISVVYDKSFTFQVNPGIKKEVHSKVIVVQGTL